MMTFDGKQPLMEEGRLMEDDLDDNHNHCLKTTIDGRYPLMQDIL